MASNDPRYMREYQRRRRKGKRSYLSEIEDLTEQVRRLEICLAWEAGELSESTAMKLLGVSRVEAREIRSQGIARGLGYETWQEWEAESRGKKKQEGE